ncbi:MAG: heavy metal-associated domain-containing protein [Muribaculaceae bacterium]|nr:heavy metal-associated domain-containing protein [Muribaculaceae bacterium]
MNFTHFINSLWVIICEMSPYILLGFFIAGLLHVFVNRATMSRHLSGKGWKPVVKAALFGIPLPLCSCGVLPTAVALRRRGASKGATTSFLIATPQTGVDSIAATYSLLGLPFAIIRPIAALAGAVAGGVAVSGFDNEKEDAATAMIAEPDEEQPHGFGRKMLAAVRYGFIDMVGSVGPWLVTGLVIAALITVFVPDSLLVGLSRYPILAMLAVVAVAIPMYVCATGSIPIALSLMMKGLSPGVAFVLLMAGPAANFASLMILHRTQGFKATAIYVSSVVVTAMAFGLLIDNLLPGEWFVPNSGIASTDACHATIGIFPVICSIVLGVLIVYTFIKGKHHNHNKITAMTKSYTIKGMACVHCKNNVEKTLARLEGVESVEVILDKGIATVNGDVDESAIKEAVELAGYEFAGEATA